MSKAIKVRKEKTPKIALTIYLFKKDAPDVEGIARNYPGITELEVKTSARKIGKLFIKRNMPSPPRWFSFFKNEVSTIPALMNNSTSGLLIIKSSTRIFGIVFGYGKSLLPTDSWEEDFGLLVTLNAVDREKIKSIDRQSFDAISTHTRSQTIKMSSLDEFGVDLENDLLRAVVGQPLDPDNGKTMTGAEALHVSVSVKVDGLPALLERYLELYGKGDYKEKFPWVDRLREVRSDTLKAQLDSMVLRKFTSNDMDRIWLAAPEILDWEGIGGFLYTSRRDEVPEADISIEGFLNALKSETICTLEMLKSRNIVCLDDASGDAKYRWPVYRCIYSEVDLGQDTYLLNNGKWYWIKRDFVKETNDYIESISVAEVSLPTYSYSDEAAYNSAAAKDSSLALMDRKMIYHGGKRDKIEFCDLFSLDRKLIHVKRYAGSSALSHLFAQGLVSGKLFKTDALFRKKVTEILPETHRIFPPDEAPAAGEYEIVFAVISAEKGDTLTLPFFSRVNLRNSHRDLIGFGYKVSLKKISITKTGASE